MGSLFLVPLVVELLIILHMSAAQTPLTKEKEKAPQGILLSALLGSSQCEFSFLRAGVTPFAPPAWLVTMNY